jgi:hypothetical protein
MLARPPTQYKEPTLDDVRDEAELICRIIEASGVESALIDILAEIDEHKANHPRGATEERKRLANAFLAQSRRGSFSTAESISIPASGLCSDGLQKRHRRCRHRLG